MHADVYLVSDLLVVQSLSDCSEATCSMPVGACHPGTGVLAD